MQEDRLNAELAVLNQKLTPDQYELQINDDVLLARFVYQAKGTSRWYRILAICRDFPHQRPLISVSGIPSPELEVFYQREFSQWGEYCSIYKIYMLCTAFIESRNSDVESDLVKAPIYAISPHRVGTDGFGVCTLVGFYGCPLNCKLCINPKSKKVPSEIELSTPLDVYNKVKHDEVLFLATTGGVTFGGGEPCLYPAFIEQFSLLCSPKWKIRVETSLNVPTENVLTLLSSVDEWLIDIKVGDKDKYKEYTGIDDELVWKNLRYLLWVKDKVVIRIPVIDEVSNSAEAYSIRDLLKGKGFEKIQIYKYHNPDEISLNRKGDCEAVRYVRHELARLNGLTISDPQCPSKICDRGTCEVCEEIYKDLCQQLASKGQIEPLLVENILPNFDGDCSKVNIAHHLKHDSSAKFETMRPETELIFDPESGEFISNSMNKFGFGYEFKEREEIIIEIPPCGGLPI